MSIPTRIRRPRKLPWPMSRIERDVTHSLWLQAKATGQPITVIVQTAINRHLTSLLDQAPLRAAEQAVGYSADASTPAA
jgi:hypothetical protein